MTNLQYLLASGVLARNCCHWLWKQSCPCT